MNTRLFPLALLVALALPCGSARAQSIDREERIRAAHVLALGRAPTAAETELWGKPGQLSIAGLVARLNPQEADARRALAIKACRDAFGREPSSDELKSWSVGSSNYTELMKQHILWLAEHPKDYALVIDRAYQLIMQRSAYSVELDYWKEQPLLSFVLLNACIENWARRNAPGLMATSGVATASVNSMWLTAVRVSPAVAAEARAAVSLYAGGGADRAAAVGRTVIAAGASAVASDGGIYFVAAGR